MAVLTVDEEATHIDRTNRPQTVEFFYASLVPKDDTYSGSHVRDVSMRKKGYQDLARKFVNATQTFLAKNRPEVA